MIARKFTFPNRQRCRRILHVDDLKEKIMQWIKDSQLNGEQLTYDVRQPVQNGWIFGVCKIPNCSAYLSYKPNIPQNCYFLAEQYVELMHDHRKQTQLPVKVITRREYCDSTFHFFEPHDNYGRLVIVTPKMQVMYSKYGKCLCLNTSFYVLKKRQCFLVTLFGLNSFRKLVIFGYSLVSDESYETMSAVLNNFISQNNTLQSDTIITPRGDGIKMAVAQLSQKYNQHLCHLLDYNFLFSKISKNKENTKKYLTLMINSQSNQEYDQAVKLFTSQMNHQDQRNISEFQNQKCFLYFSQIPRSFTHLGYFCPSPFEEFRKKDTKLVSSTYKDLLTKADTFFKQINQNSLKKELCQQQESMPEQLLQSMRFFSKLVFEQIKYQYKKMVSDQDIEKANQFTYSFNKNNNSNKATVRKSHKGELFCSCGYKQKTQLPCHHLIKVAIKNNMSIFQLVGEFYKAQQDEDPYLHRKEPIIQIEHQEQ